MILEEIVDRITGRWAASFRAWMYLSSIGFAGTVTRSYATMGITHKESILLAFAITVINAPVYALICNSILRKRFTEQLSLARVFSSYILIWLSVGVTEILITVYVFHQTAYLGPQLFASLFPDVFGFITTSYLLAEFEKNRIDISRLSFARKTLVKTSEDSHKQVVAERSQLISAIQDSVFYQLDAMKKQFALIRQRSDRQEIERLALELEDYATKTIRNLSHEMANDVGIKNPIDRLTFIGQQKIKNFTNAYSPYISFGLSMAVIIFIGGNHEISLNGFPGFVFQIGTAVAIAPILFLGSQLTSRISPKNLSLGFLVFLTTIFLAGYVTVIIINIPALKSIELKHAYAAPVFAARTLVCIIMASLIVTIVKARRKTLSDLIAMNEKLQIDLDWMDSRSRELRKELASILHGPLQGRIAGVAMALRLIAADNEISEEEKKRKLAEIETLLASVIDDVQKLFNFEKNQPEASFIIKLIDLRRSWDGLAKVSWQIEPNVFAALPTSRFNMVSEILYEAVSNSVRHGGATSVNISLRIKGSDLSLTIIDNGIGIKKAVIAGAGMHKISEFGATFSFTQNLDRGAELFINVPLNK
ncbi:MAG: hypothetical protein F2708_05055 [Actinobacteria bacterium]|uniref:histidine kinase n=1 Tax=freshwater metagenome TaxID=449393 RepID=A0A6J6UPU3_9ZZZZ|nr:hypothetical protein [Actinomycetota bacterium]